MTPAGRGRAGSWLLRILVLACAGVSVLVLAEAVQAMAARLASPLVYDRLGGCIVDHVVRLRQGLPIYAEPDERFVAVVYTPLYYVLAAGVMSVVGEGVFACRLTSVLLVAGCVAVAVALVRLVTPRPGWALLALPVAAAGYGVCLLFYDAPRTDPASSLALLLAIWAAARFEGLRGAAAVGACLGLAYFSKQSTLAFSGVFLLGWAGLELRRAALAGLVFGAGTGAAIGVMNWVSDGWFWTYCGYLTGQHELPLERLGTTLRNEWGGTLLIPVLVCVAGALALTFSRRKGRPERSLRLLLIGALGIALMCVVSRMRVGSTLKVLMPFCLVAAAALPACCAWLEDLRPGRRWRAGVRSLALLLAMGYMLQNRIDPAEALPTPDALERWEALKADVERYAQRGQVWVGPWGYFTTPMEGQGMRPEKIALEDYLGIRGHSTGLPIPPALKTAIREQEFVAIFWTVTAGNERLDRLLARYYEPVGVSRAMLVGTRAKEVTIVAWEPRGGR